MHKLFIIIALSLTACNNAVDMRSDREPYTATLQSASIHSSLPAGFTVVEPNTDGTFIRLASAERASSGTIRELADSLSGSFARVDLCLNVAHERGDEYLAIIDGKVYDYENNRIYSLK